MKEIRPRGALLIRIWWAFAWRAVVIGWGVNLAVVLLLWLAGINTEAGVWGPTIVALLSLVIQIGAQIWAFGQIIGADFDDFRLVLAETFVQAQLRELEEGPAGS